MQRAVGIYLTRARLIPIFSKRTSTYEEGPVDAAPLNSPIEGQFGSKPLTPIAPSLETKEMTIDEILGSAHKLPLTIVVESDQNKEVMDIGGVPQEHREARRVKIYMPSRNAMQAGLNNTGIWKIELDNRERWENPTIGYCSNADPLSNISMQLQFASKLDAINFCEKNRWLYEICEPQERVIKPKAYGSNFSWNKRTRVSTK